MGACESRTSGKDVHNTKARSRQQIQHLRGGRALPGGVYGESRGVQEVLGEKWLKHEKTRKS